MTTLTTNYQLRKPDGTDAASNVAIDNLADDVDAALNAHIPALEALLYLPATQTLVGSAASVTFSSIPSTLKTVEVKWSARGDAAVPNIGISLRINGDSSTLYSGQKMQGSNTSVTASTFVTQNAADLGSILAASATAGRYGSGSVELAAWDGHAKLNGISKFGGFDVAATNSFTGQVAFMYEAAGPFTSITLMPAGGGNFVAGSEFKLVGWK